MKKIVSTLCFLSMFLALFGQSTPPAWLNEDARELRYPSETFYTGLAYTIVDKGQSSQDFVERTKNDAQSELVKKIRVKIEAKTQSTIATQNTNGKYTESEGFSSEAKMSSDAEIVGIKIESYYDKTANTIYAFAYVNKYELAGYYKANIGMLLQQVEGGLSTAEQLEQSGEKSKARKQCEEAIPLFAKVRYAQDLLTAIDAADSESLQQAKSENLRSKATQILARLAQGVYVYVESKEAIFDDTSNLITNKIKGELTRNGCSFVNDVEQADFKLILSASIRELKPQQGNLMFAYVDVVVDLFDNHKQKSVYHDEIAQKADQIHLNVQQEQRWKMYPP
ncbi:hypothetical protein FACS1894201_06380 [Bacteroidia bacterium]|nr:hypothetical protein FACS1894201_06380 [Bacteroidia bacterium]